MATITTQHVPRAGEGLVRVGPGIAWFWDPAGNILSVLGDGGDS